jgi:hypothetical protein
LRDSARCSSSHGATTRRRRSNSPTAEFWSACPLRRCFSTRTTSSIWRPHCETPGSGLAQLQSYRLDPDQADRVQTDPLGTARHRRGARLPIRKRSFRNSATSTSPRVRPVSGRQPCAILRVRAFRQCRMRSIPAVALPSTCYMATSKRDSGPSHASCCSRTPMAHGAATLLIIGE